MKHCAIFSAVLFSVIISMAGANDLSGAFTENEIVPDIIDEAPSETLLVKYGSGQVNLGNEFSPDKVQSQPQVTWNADPNKYYLLALLDPDAPNRKVHTYREFNHWLIGNILGGNIQSGDSITDYMGPAPPKGSGLHRYVFLLFEQPGKVSFEEKKVNRPNFKIRKFAKKYKLGGPIAGNFFQSQSA